MLYEPSLVSDEDRLLAVAAGADALIVRNKTQVRGKLLDALVSCKVVGRLGVGLDNIDVAECERRNIRLIVPRGANAHSVAEYVLATSMFLLRGAYTSTSLGAAGKWPRESLSRGREIAGKTMGIVGFGSIGQCVAVIARALGVEVLAYDPALSATDVTFAANQVECTSLEDLVARSDVVSLHVPLVDSTRNLFDGSMLDKMRRGAVLVNTARGGVVDEVAVAFALKSGQLGGAALDVFSSEPGPVQPHFEGCSHLILTPHIAGVTVESNERVSRSVASGIIQALRDFK